MPKAYSYLRFSTPEQAQGDSYRRQTVLAEAYAQQHGLELDTSLRFTDEGISAFKGKNAATGALRKFMRAVEDGDIEEGSYLLVESLDRISRNAVTDAQGLFLSIIGLGVTLVTLGDGKVYSKAAINKNPVDLIVSLLVMIRAHEESLTKSTRIKQAWVSKRAKAAEGGLLTSQVPAWLQVEEGQIVVIPDRAEVVQRIYRLTLEGWGRERIARTLNEEGIQPWGRAAHWNYSYINKIQANPAVIGTLVTRTVEHEGGKAVRKEGDRYEGYYPAIIDPETFARVQTLRGDQPKTKGDTTIKNILSGLAVCPCCGARMVRITKGSNAKSGSPYLLCSKVRAGAGCQYKAVRLDNIETAITCSYDQIRVALLSHGSQGLAKEVENLEAEEMALSDHIEEAANAIIEMGTSTIMTRKLRALETQREELVAELKAKRAIIQAQASGTVRARLGDLSKAIAGGQTHKVNTVLRELFKTATVDYHTGQLVMTAHSGAEVSLTYQWVD